MTIANREVPRRRNGVKISVLMSTDTTAPVAAPAHMASQMPAPPALTR